MVQRNRLSRRTLAERKQLLVLSAFLFFSGAVYLHRWDDVTRLAQTASAVDKQNALALAALHGNVQGLHTLITLGVDLNACRAGFSMDVPPLHHAVSSGSLEAVQMLVEAGAALAAKDPVWNLTPLGWAKYYQHALKEEEAVKRYSAITRYLREEEG